MGLVTRSPGLIGLTRFCPRLSRGFGSVRYHHTSTQGYSSLFDVDCSVNGHGQLPDRNRDNRESEPTTSLVQFHDNRSISDLYGEALPR